MLLCFVQYLVHYHKNLKSIMLKDFSHFNHFFGPHETLRIIITHDKKIQLHFSCCRASVNLPFVFFSLFF